MRKYTPQLGRMLHIMSLRSVSPLSPIMTDDEILAKAEAIKKQRKIAEKQRIAEANGRVRPVNLD